MKKLLIPTDFSENSTNALEYAIELNKKLNAEIVLFHSYFVPILATDVPEAIPSDVEIRQAALESLTELRNKYQKLFPMMIFRTELANGFPETEIPEAGKRLNSDIIVMGTLGTNPFKKFLLGSNTSVVLEKSTCPVITVPEHAKFKHLNKIVYAANYAVDDYKNVFDLIEFAKQFSSEIILLHVSTGEVEKSFDFNQLDNFKMQIIEESGYKNITIKLFEDKNVFEGLNVYLDEINADLFSISMRNRSFLKRFFKPSLTKKMAYHSHLPVMVFHTEE